MDDVYAHRCAVVDSFDDLGYAPAYLGGLLYYYVGMIIVKRINHKKMVFEL
jgi:hypothetical protein